ncbi:hypothetical protein BDN70DRAFT_939866 [Pholiota conissans]|uniref:Uncharacterized protein n=1 Tax=Pholiota conissans TaxID=109636 RepID=A0A9P5YKF4_9AGAR|nr:hypothetical protein BDN70DRAFT_939866 [Pholiota conissans]
MDSIYLNLRVLLYPPLYSPTLECQWSLAKDDVVDAQPISTRYLQRKPARLPTTPTPVIRIHTHSSRSLPPAMGGGRIVVLANFLGLFDASYIKYSINGITVGFWVCRFTDTYSALGGWGTTDAIKRQQRKIPRSVFNVDVSIYLLPYCMTISHPPSPSCYTEYETALHQISQTPYLPFRCVRFLCLKPADDAMEYD